MNNLINERNELAAKLKEALIKLSQYNSDRHDLLADIRILTMQPNSSYARIIRDRWRFIFQFESNESLLEDLKKEGLTK